MLPRQELWDAAVDHAGEAVRQPAAAAAAATATTVLLHPFECADCHGPAIDGRDDPAARLLPEGALVNMQLVLTCEDRESRDNIGGWRKLEGAPYMLS